MQKEKKCKGIGKAKDFKGCGKMTLFRKYGLCTDEGNSCYAKFLLKTKFGSELTKKTIKTEKEKGWRKRKTKLKNNLETLSSLKKDLQIKINYIVRTLDRGHRCISSNRKLGLKFDAGHLYSVGSNPQIRFHLFNIWAQSVHDNQWKSGNPLEFVKGLELNFGKEISEYCEGLKQNFTLKLSKEEIKEKIIIANDIAKNLKKRPYTQKERLDLRKEFNKKLGIYDF